MSGTLSEEEQVREAILSDRFDTVSLSEVERYLEEHPDCARWAAETLALRRLIARAKQDEPVERIEDEELHEYLAGRLPKERRARVETACCHSLETAGRLEQLRRGLLQRQLRELDPTKVLRIAGFIRAPATLRMPISLAAFSDLYESRTHLIAAAEGERQTFQSSDGRMVIAVQELGPSDHAGTRRVMIELGVRVHDDELSGQWVQYTVLNAEGKPAAAGLVCLDPDTAVVVVPVPRTTVGPYHVDVRLLALSTDDMIEALERLGAHDAPITPDDDRSRS